ncbi:MAG: hypothetical protein E3J72_01170 [Planctomycetota bacterium]|nr:MAG: hypothetical protein E3J72_01170 [Planctomycetota bacterium]
MAIRLKCKCGQAMQVDESMAGKTGKCPKCGTAMQVPSQKQITEFKIKTGVYKKEGSSLKEVKTDPDSRAQTGTGAPEKTKRRAPKRSTKRLRGGKVDTDDAEEKTRLRKSSVMKTKKRGKTAVIKGGRDKKGKAGSKRASAKVGRSSRKGAAAEGSISARYAQPKKKYVVPLLIIGGVVVLGLIGYGIFYNIRVGHVDRLKRFNEYVKTTQSFREHLAEYAVEYMSTPPVLGAYDNEEDGPKSIIDRDWNNNIVNPYLAEGFMDFGEDYDYQSYLELERLKEAFIGEDMATDIRLYTQLKNTDDTRRDVRRFAEVKKRIRDRMVHISKKLKEVTKELRGQFYYYKGGG